MLTISQLADYVGVTVRAIRHYHQRGLLAEPDRDSSGYRRYDAPAVLALIRIKTLAEAGVPLARVEELLAARPEEFAEAVTQIDKALEAKISELGQHRRRIAQLAAGERLLLPDEIVGLLDDLRALGISERTIEVERDGWIMLTARYGEAIVEHAVLKRSYLAAPEFRRFYRLYDQACEWEPDDPRVEELASEMRAYFEEQSRREDRDIPYGPGGGSSMDAELVSHLSDHSPAWERLNRMATKRAGELGYRVV